MSKAFFFLVSIVCSLSFTFPVVADSDKALVSADVKAKQEVARFFRLTNAINVAPVKKRLEALINRKLKNENSGLSSSHYKIVSAVVSREIDHLVDQKYFLNRYAGVYLKHYTVEELRQVNDFFSSPAGKKFITARAALQKEVSTSTVKMIHQLVDELAPKVKASLNQAGHEINL